MTGAASWYKECSAEYHFYTFVLIYDNANFNNSLHHKGTRVALY